MSTFITSDLHLGEERMEILGRPFLSGDECIEHMISEHNKIVSPEDIVIIVGDLCYQKTPDRLPLIDKFNGKKTLIRGNHDRELLDSELYRYFENVIPEGDGVEITVGDIKCWATHYPSAGREDRFNLVGHIHSAWKYQLNMMNVGVDVNHFRPVNLERIPFHFKAICEYYDEDVWTAYNSINTKFVGIRGKSGTYFPK